MGSIAMKATPTRISFFTLHLDLVPRVHRGNLTTNTDVGHSVVDSTVEAVKQTPKASLRQRENIRRGPCPVRCAEPADHPLAEEELARRRAQLTRLHDYT